MTDGRTEYDEFIRQAHWRLPLTILFLGVAALAFLSVLPGRA